MGRARIALAHTATLLDHMGRHRFEHDNEGASIFDLAQLVTAVAAVVIALTALLFSRRESIRAGNRERLMWMHTALNHLETLQDHALAPHKREYEELQQWLKTSLAVSGARKSLR